ncbi:MAG TPA: hypothetical protein VFK45_01250 [Gammaproteobacteria bacterium]|nr:hypothetical protein [Gammaproteobacteria bacterium]
MKAVLGCDIESEILWQTVRPDAVNDPISPFKDFSNVVLLIFRHESAGVRVAADLLAALGHSLGQAVSRSQRFGIDGTLGVAISNARFDIAHNRQCVVHIRPSCVLRQLIGQMMDFLADIVGSGIHGKASQNTITAIIATTSSRAMIH